MEVGDCPASCALSCLQDIARTWGIPSWSSQHLNCMPNRDVFIQRICCKLAKAGAWGQNGEVPVPASGSRACMCGVNWSHTAPAGFSPGFPCSAVWDWCVYNLLGSVPGLDYFFCSFICSLTSVQLIAGKCRVFRNMHTTLELGEEPEKGVHQAIPEPLWHIQLDVLGGLVL